MDIKIELVKKEEKEILRNLMEKYRYEFSQYDNLDTNNFGLYGYDYFDYYWTENNRNAVLYAATHNTCYDAQVEGSGRDYLFDAIKLSGDSCFLEKIIECFHKPKDFHLSSQLRGLLYRFWENGYDKAEPETNNNN